MKPRGAQDAAKMGSRRAPWRRLGGLGPLSWVVWRLLEPSWAAPGASRGAPGAHLGLPGGSFWSVLAFCGRLPCEIAETTKIVDSTALCDVFRGPRGPRLAPKSLRNPTLACLAASEDLWRPRGAVLGLSGPVLGPSAWLLGRPWGAPGRSEPTGPRGTHVTSSPKIV